MDGETLRMTLVAIRLQAQSDEEYDAAVQALLGGNGEAALAVEPVKKKYAYAGFDIADCSYPRSQGSPVKRLKELSESIPNWALADEGRPDHLHVTVKYGFTSDDSQPLIDLLEDHDGVQISFGPISLFENPDADVVKVEVTGSDLHRLNKLCCSLPHMDTHDGYKPHVTLAYVKPGLGKQFIGPSGLEGSKAFCERLIFSDPDKNKTIIPLGKQIKKRSDRPKKRPKRRPPYRKLSLTPRGIGLAIEERIEAYGTEPPGEGWTAQGDGLWTREGKPTVEKTSRVCVVGGGPGGLFTAWLLNQKAPSCDVTIFEASERLGGKIKTETFDDGTPYEGGVAELYEYLGPGGKDPLRLLVEKDLGLKTYDMSGGCVVLGDDVLADLDAVEKEYGKKTRQCIERFHERCAQLMSLEAYTNRWQPDNAHPWANKTFRECVEGECGDDCTARAYILAAVHSDLATEPHICNGLNGIKNILMDNPKYLRLYHVEDGIESVVYGLQENIEATVHLGARVISVRKKGEQYRVEYRVDGRPAHEDFDAVVVAMPNHLLAQIDWEQGKTGGAALGMVGDEWHGPTPPGADWVQSGQGPHGGKIWRKKSGGTSPGTPPSQNAEMADLQESLQKAIQIGDRVSERGLRLMLDRMKSSSAPLPEPPASSHASVKKVFQDLKFSALSSEKKVAYWKAMESVLSSMPPTSLDRIFSNLDHITFYEDTSTLTKDAIQAAMRSYMPNDPNRRAMEDELKNAERGTMKAGGMYMDGQLHLDGDFQSFTADPGRHSPGESWTTREVYAHELGHAIDGKNQELSSSSDWNNVWKHEIVANQSANPRLTSYAQTKPAEGFAEFSRLLYGSNVPLDRIVAEFPAAADFFAKHKLIPTGKRSEAGGGMQELFNHRVQLPGGAGNHADARKAPAPGKPSWMGSHTLSIQDSMRRLEDHYDHPAHYLRVSLLFRTAWWRRLPVHGDFWMMDCLGGLCMYDESHRWGHDGPHVLSALLAGQPALALCCGNQTNSEIVERLLDALPPCMQADARAELLESRVHRWLGSLNAQPGGWPAEELRGEHQPDPDGHPGLFLASDAFFDSTLNGTLISASCATDLLCEFLGMEKQEPSKTVEQLDTTHGGALAHA